LLELVRAFRYLLDEGLPIHLTVAGEPWYGTEEAFSELALCASDNYTTHLRYISDSEVNALFSDCDILVAPYRRISASGPISMAMGVGMPIVTTRLPSLIEVCEGYDGVEWAEVNDPDSLASAMKRALLRVGQTYQNFHSWDTNAKRYSEFFSKL